MLKPSYRPRPCNIQRGFKLIERTNNVLHSVHAPVQVQYFSTGWNTPEPGHGPYTVFNNELAAVAALRVLRSLYPNRQFELWEVNYVPSKRRLVWQRQQIGAPPVKSRLDAALPSTQLATAFRLVHQWTDERCNAYMGLLDHLNQQGELLHLAPGTLLKHYHFQQK